MSIPNNPGNFNNALFRTLIQLGVQNAKENGIKMGEAGLQKAREVDLQDIDLSKIIKNAGEAFNRVVPQQSEKASTETVEPKQAPVAAPPSTETNDVAWVAKPVKTPDEPNPAPAYIEKDQINKNVDNIYEVSLNLSAPERDMLIASVLNLVNIFAPESRSQDLVSLVARLYGNKDI